MNITTKKLIRTAIVFVASLIGFYLMANVPMPQTFCNYFDSIANHGSDAVEFMVSLAVCIMFVGSIANVIITLNEDPNY